MTGPKDPIPNEAEQADDLADSPGGQPARPGSGDAELISGDGKAEGDVESGTGGEPDAATTDVGAIND